jgi:hypothetical protein
MSRKKISTTIYVTPEQSDKLKLLHERTKVPVAVYIREGIDLVLRQYAHLLPGQLALDARASTPPPPSAVPGGTVPGEHPDADDEHTRALREEHAHGHAHGHATAHASPAKK